MMWVFLDALDIPLMDRNGPAVKQDKQLNSMEIKINFLFSHPQACLCIFMKSVIILSHYKFLIYFKLIHYKFYTILAELMHLFANMLMYDGRQVPIQTYLFLFFVFHFCIPIISKKSCILRSNDCERHLHSFMCFWVYTCHMLTVQIPMTPAQDNDPGVGEIHMYMNAQCIYLDVLIF